MVLYDLHLVTTKRTIKNNVSLLDSDVLMYPAGQPTTSSGSGWHAECSSWLSALEQLLFLISNQIENLNPATTCEDDVAETLVDPGKDTLHNKHCVCVCVRQSITAQIRNNGM